MVLGGFLLAPPFGAELPKGPSRTVFSTESDSVVFLREKNQGCQNGAFGKRSFCWGDTRHFRHFRRFPGSDEQNPLFLWAECNTRTFADFVKTTCFRQGTKRPFTKTTVSTTLKKGT